MLDTNKLYDEAKQTFPQAADVLFANQNGIYDLWTEKIPSLARFIGIDLMNEEQLKNRFYGGDSCIDFNNFYEDANAVVAVVLLDTDDYSEDGGEDFQEGTILWYAIMADSEDLDWGTGTFNRDEAITRMNELNNAYEAEGFDRDSYIAVIDANYKYAEGKGFIPTSSPVCVDTISE